MFGRFIPLLIGSVSVSLFGFAWASYSIATNTPTSTTQQPLFVPVQSPSLPEETTNRVGAIGLIEPAGEAIAIGSPVPGIVARVLVRPGDSVVAGQILFVIDDTTSQAERRIAQAELSVAEQRVTETRAQILVARSRLAAAEAALNEARIDLREREDLRKRAEMLSRTRAASVEERDQRRYAAEVGKARVADAEAKWQEARANLSLLVQDANHSELAAPAPGPTLALQEAQRARARSALEQAEVRLKQHTVRAPQNATVLKVNLRVGEYAPAALISEPLMVLGVIDPLHVRVEIEEADIGRFRPESEAVASLRGQPEQRARLRFVRCEPLVIPKRVLTGAASERVDTRVMQVIYALSPSDLPARPGQQVDVFLQAPAR